MITQSRTIIRTRAHTHDGLSAPHATGIEMAKRPQRWWWSAARRPAVGRSVVRRERELSHLNSSAQLFATACRSAHASTSMHIYMHDNSHACTCVFDSWWQSLNVVHPKQLAGFSTIIDYKCQQIDMINNMKPYAHFVSTFIPQWIMQLFNILVFILLHFSS